MEALADIFHDKYLHDAILELANHPNHADLEILMRGMYLQQETPAQCEQRRATLVQFKRAQSHTLRVLNMILEIGLTERAANKIVPKKEFARILVDPSTEVLLSTVIKDLGKYELTEFDAYFSKLPWPPRVQKIVADLHNGPITLQTFYNIRRNYIHHDGGHLFPDCREAISSPAEPALLYRAEGTLYAREYDTHVLLFAWHQMQKEAAKMISDAL